ncbi:uncharacterized protein N7496_002885 [Penicillium cataractarum]|uniref:2-methylcitrate dehydratase n=1 Tax=Penicillium cataractarum TaxID=2100454 RepID=A0A9W9VFW3_9EURO|nr:uncharacterized protein N7496_002885 [Penicillium cataractarum]KAJ5380457.1 hypothetical protein N7496_002885 [Penicillium cataractarum]
MEPAYDQPITDIARYIFHYEIDKADEKVWARARLALLDTLGCAIETAATSDECRKLLGLTSKDMIVPDGFRVPGTNLQVDPLEGAFDFGVLIRYLDHNDALGGAEWGHPSDNIATILAVMDWSSRMAASGRLVHTGPPLTMRTLLIALIKAYEIQGCYQMRNAFNAYGIDHVVLVKLASVAVVSWLLGLTEEQTMACISHVWMDGQPTRVYRVRDNTIPRKGWAAGDAARRAVQLALYVQAGQPGSPGALSSRPWGFWARTFGETGFQFARPFGTWTIQNVLFKAMPVEGHAVSAVEAVLLQMRRCKEIGLSNPMQDIKRIDLRTTAAADLIINKKGPLRNAADRDHCIQYVVALACLKGSAPEAVDYLDTSPWATNEDLMYLMDKITVSPDPVLTHDYLDLDKKSLGTGVTIHLKNQSVLPEILVEYPLGHVRNPRTNAFLEAKFSQNMARMFSARETAQIAGAVHRPDLQVTSFVNLLARPADQPKL